MSHARPRHTFAGLLSLIQLHYSSNEDAQAQGSVTCPSIQQLAGEAVDGLFLSGANCRDADT